MIWIAAATWLFLASLIMLFFYASDGGRWMWLHARWPVHKQRLARAVLCVEAANHWQEPYITRQFLDQAFKLCEDCGCPPDMWPAEVLELYAGSWVK